MGCASKQSQTLSPMAAASGVRWDRRLTARLRVDQRLTGVSSRRGPPASSTRPSPTTGQFPHHRSVAPHPTNPHRADTARAPHHCAALDSPPFLCRAAPAPPPKRQVAKIFYSGALSPRPIPTTPRSYFSYSFPILANIFLSIPTE